MREQARTAIPERDDQAVIDALVERFLWERIDRLTVCVYPYKKDREPLQASRISIILDSEPRDGSEYRALHMSYHGATVSTGLPDALADYMERERPFHRLLGLDSGLPETPPAAGKNGSSRGAQA